MKRLLATAMIATSCFALQFQPTYAQSYPIDCAILLCLAGGWPASAPCAQARAEFIRRITPWPIEPPLQIWRCPMNTVFRVPSDEGTSPRLRDAGLAAPSAQQSQFRGAGKPPPALEEPAAPAVFRSGRDKTEMQKFLLQLAQAVGSGADIDISGQAFDFVRSIDVWHIRYSVSLTGSAKNCFISDQTDHGSYGVQGDFRWTGSAAKRSPAWIRPTFDCNNPGMMRAVGVSWTDSFGAQGHEVVTY